MARSGYWNPNVHYQPVILKSVPPGCQDALDIGCGDGMLARHLAGRCAEVTGIDRDARMIALARSGQDGRDGRDGRTTFIEADFLAYPFEAASFDFVCANTSLHHMDFTAALSAIARVLRPGGRLAVIGLGADRSLADWLVAAACVPAAQFYRAIYRKGSSGAPILDPDLSWREVRAEAARLLPGVRYNRLMLFRYSLLWTKPRD